LRGLPGGQGLGSCVQLVVVAVGDRRGDVALFRYSLIREAADPELSKGERGALVRHLAAREHVMGDGTRVRVGRSTLDRWIQRWRTGGFDALVDPPRQVVPGTPGAALDLAVKLKREVPGRTAAQVAAIIMTAEGVAISERTVQRLFARHGLNTRPDGTPPAAFGRFEAAARNDRWTGDALHGPVVAGRKTYLFAFIDDHSRAIPGHRWGLSEDTVRLEAALRHGLASRGVPKSIYVDNGSSFVAAPLIRACAVLGIRLVCQGPRGSPRRRPGVLPGDGRVFSPGTAGGFPRGRPWVLPVDGRGGPRGVPGGLRSAQGRDPLAGEGVGEADAVAVGDEHVGVVQQPVDQGGGDGAVHELIEPGGMQVGGHRQRPSFVGGVDEAVEAFGCVRGQWEHPDVIDLCGYPHRSICADTATMPTSPPWSV
jgi:transposase